MSMLPMQQNDYGQPVLQDISRQRKLADQLRAQGQEQLNGQMVSGHYVAPSITQHLAKMLQSYQAGSMQRGADQQEKDYGMAKNKAFADILQGNKPQSIQDGTTQPMQAPERTFDQFGSPTQGQDLTPQPNGAPVPNMRNENSQEQMARVQPQVLEYMQKYGATPESQFMLAQLGKQDDRAYAKGEKVEDRAYTDTREENLYKRGRDDKLSDVDAERKYQDIVRNDAQGFQVSQQDKQFANAYKMQAQSQGFQAGQNALNMDQQVKLNGSNSAPVSVIGPDGRPKYVTRQEALGQRPYSASDDAKQVAKDSLARAKKDGAGIVDNNIALLRDAYTQLDKGYGIVSPSNSPLSNFGAYTSSSGIGQRLGGAFGTENQTQRDKIEQTRPLLLQSIMKATGMSAKQMDSNAELKLWLSTATDPTKSLDANRAALDNIEKMYGSGVAEASLSSAGSQDSEAVTWAKSNPNDPRSKAILQANGVK